MAPEMAFADGCQTPKIRGIAHLSRSTNEEGGGRYRYLVVVLQDVSTWEPSPAAEPCTDGLPYFTTCFELLCGPPFTLSLRDMVYTYP